MQDFEILTGALIFSAYFVLIILTVILDRPLTRALQMRKAQRHERKKDRLFIYTFEKRGNR